MDREQGEQEAPLPEAECNGVLAVVHSAVAECDNDILLRSVLRLERRLHSGASTPPRLQSAYLLAVFGATRPSMRVH